MSYHITSFLLTDVEDYAPANLRAENKINHKTYLKWDIPETLPDKISYEVYRSTAEDFEPDESNLIASDVKAGYYTEVDAVHGKTYYYKVRAVESYYDEWGLLVENYSTFSEVRSARTVDLNESLKHLGMKEFWEFTQFNTPNGNGYVEKSAGNFLYQQKDAELPNEGFDVSLTRAYNSQASTQGTFGFGWSHEYDIELLNISEDNSLAFTHVILKDGNGTIYHFTRGAGDRYFISSLGSYVNLTAENEEKTKTVTISGAESSTVELKYQFILSTKDGVAYYFNSGGQLILMEDANGKFVLFEHDAHKGVLSRMVTNNNIAIDFTYNDGTGGTDPLTVKEISMPDGSKVQYEYTKPFMSAEQLLTKVTEVSGTESIEYEYAYDKPLLSSQPRNLTVIKDAEHKYQYKINYDFETDQVKEAVYPNDEKFTFTYAPDNTCTLTKKYSGGQAVLGEKDFFNKITGHCEKSIRGVTDVEILEGTNEAGLDVTTYEYRDNLLISSTSTAQYYEVNTDGYVVKKSGFRENAAKYSGDDPVKETEEDGTVSDYTYYTEADGAHLDGLIKTVKETNASGKVSSDKLYTYDAAGNVTQVIDYAAGTKTVNTYYAEGTFKGELNTMTESTITVTGANQIESETLKSTSVYVYAYHTADGMTTKTETCTQTIPKPDGTNEVITTSQKYDQMGRMLTDTDSRGYQTINAYDGFGRITGTTYKYSDSDQLKQQTSRSYDKNGMTTYEKLEDGIEKWYAYDNMGRITSIRVKKGDADDETINYTYRYEDINVYQGKGTDTVAVNHAYVTRQAYADGTIISEAYEDHCGNKVRVYEGGLYTDMTYSSQGDMITKWQMGQTLSATEGLLEIYLYDEKGNLTETITDPDYVPGTSTTGFHVRPDSYDENDMLIQGSIVSKSRYDADGNAVEQTDPRGNTTQYAYDKDGNLLSVLLPDQAKYEYQYDIEGTGNTTMDVVLEPRAFGTDAARQMSKSIVVKDSTDKTIKVEDLGISDADGTSISTTYEYDIRDNLVKATEKNGNYKAYTYDSRNRVIAIDYYEMGNETAARTLRTEFSYDAADNLTAMADKEVQDGAESMYRYTAYGYDGFNRLVWVSECKTNAVPAETVIDANKVSYGYDSKDRLVSIDYANSSNGVTGLRFIYNIHGWLMKVNAVNGSNSEKLLRQYAYTDDGKVSVITDYTDFLNGTGKWLKRTYEYDKLNRPVSIAYTDNMSGSTAEVKESHTYAYDKNNNIISETKLNAYGTGNGANYQETYSYQYDANNRLSFSCFGHMPTQYEDANDVETTYSYNAAGNKTAEMVFTSGWSHPMEFENSFTYNEFNQLTTSRQEDMDSCTRATYTYDQNGNQVSKTDTDLYTGEAKQTLYAYDAANRLKTATGKTGGAVDYVQENKYNGFGQRVQKKEGNDVTNYFYDGSAVLYTTDGDDTATSFNLVGTEDNILSTARTEADGTTSFFVYTKDIRESTTNIIGKNGQAEVSYDYDIYGETTEHQKDSADPFYNEICYTAGIYDDTTGLYNLNARYYSPADQTFLTQDTYRGSRSKTATLNYYAYCAGNPVSYTDPSGHAFWGVVGAAMGAYDGYKYAKKKNLKGWKKAAAIGVGAALGAINPFKVVKAVKTVSKVYKASKYAKKAASAKKTATAAKKVAAKPKQTVTTKKSTINTIRTNATKKQGQQVKRIQKRVDNPGCFVAGTKIHAKDGYRNIEAIKAGDYVWSENPETKEKALKRVKKIFVREKDSIIRLAINGEVIETTDEHPFYVENVGFVAAKDLKAGDEVRLATGDPAEVETSERIALAEPIQVYNFEVEDFHTYYVSGQKVLVHNTCAVTKKNAPQTSQPTHTGTKANYTGKVKSGNGDVPANFSPEGAGRRGAFREAKRASGIPVSQHPKSVGETKGNSGKPIPGREYVFDSPNRGGSGSQDDLIIREHFGHEYPDNPAQNRGNHFNDIHKNHYDY